MSSEQSQLRTTSDRARCSTSRSRNRARGAGALRLFEAGAVYLPAGEALPDEPYHVGALLAGPVRPATWRDRRLPAADFFAAKGVLAGLLDASPASSGRSRRLPSRSRSCIRAAPRRIMLGARRGRLDRRAPPAGRG